MAGCRGSVVVEMTEKGAKSVKGGKVRKVWIAEQVGNDM